MKQIFGKALFFRRLFLYILFFCSTSQLARSQWTTADASGNINNTNTGNVGISTTSPKALLDFGYGNGVKCLFYGSGGTAGYYWGTGVNLGQSPNEASVFIGGAAGSCCGSENFAVVSANQSSWPYTSYTTRFVVNSQTGNAGIGTINPLVKLAISGDLNTERINIISSVDPVISLYHQNGTTATPTAVVAGNYLGYYQLGGYDGSQNTRVAWITGIATQNWTSTSHGAGMVFSTTPDASTTMTERMRIDQFGNVGIGTTNTQGYQLAVNGSAIFTKAVVKIYSTWPDYVFKQDYLLPSLDSVSKYIQTFNHLPGMPSAGDVGKNGLDLGSNQAAQLKKIEELTLYVIEQNKQLEEQKRLLSAQSERMSRLEELVAQKANK